MQASLDSFQTEDDLIFPWGGAMRLSLSFSPLSFSLFYLERRLQRYLFFE